MSLETPGPARGPFAPFLRQQRCVVLDGGLATELERANHDLDDPLWSAKVLLDAPEAIASVHRAYLEAGADCITAATYQASVPGFTARGLSTDRANRAIVDAVRLAVEVRDAFTGGRPPHQRKAHPRPAPLVAVSVGPFGACLADGSEYRGHYGIDDEELDVFHRDRWRLLLEGGADLMACETLPSLREARVLAGLARECGTPTWISFTCRDGSHIAEGTSLAEVGEWAEAAEGVYAVGVNCTPWPAAVEAVGALRATTQKPIVAYPNAGGHYDAASKTWAAPPTEVDWADVARRLWEAGATAIGGCCRVTPDATRAVARWARAREPECPDDTG